MSAMSGWCLDANSGHFPKLSANMHATCGERLADPCAKPDRCDCTCGHDQPFAGREL